MVDGVTVVDVDHGALLPDQRVVVAGNRIQTVGDVRKVPLPSKAHVVDARGKYLIPGLWDMHVHPEESAPTIFNPLLIANGVTGIRDAHSRVPLATQRVWRQEILAGTRVGPPRQLLSGQPVIDEVDEARTQAKVDSLHAAGSDIIKTYVFSRGDVYFAAPRAARRLGMRIGGHLPPGVSPLEASDSGAMIIDHIAADLFGSMAAPCMGEGSSLEACGEMAETFKRNGTWWVPTLGIGPGARWPASKVVLSHLQEVERRVKAGGMVNAAWLRGVVRPGSADSADTVTERHLTLAGRVGMPLMAGTDAAVDTLSRVIPGFPLHAELAIYVAEGLTPAAALRTATLEPARFVHGTDSLGTVAAGKLADLVLLDGNPLADIGNTTAIRAVVANGRYFDRAALDRLVALGGAAFKAKLQALPVLPEEKKPDGAP